MKTSKRIKVERGLAAACILAVLSTPAAAALSNSFFKPTVSEYWEDAANWYDENYATSAGSVPAHWTNARFAESYPCRVKSHVSKEDGSYRQYGITIGDHQGVTASLFLENGGYLSANWCQIGCGANSTGLLDVAAGAKFHVDQFGLHVGMGGHGIVTNAGTIAYNDCAVVIGEDSWGTWVQDGGSIEKQWEKDLIVGQGGRGELIVKSGTFNWPGAHTRGCGIGDVFVGRSQQDNALVVKRDAKMTCKWLTVGSALDGAGGRGSLLVEPSAQLTTTYLVVGAESGSTGIVTNQGTIVYDDHVVIGDKAGSCGIVVHDGGEIKQKEYQKNLTIGRLGRGELIVKSGIFHWPAYVPGAGGINVGQSQLENRMVIENGASARLQFLALGGRFAGEAGRGELLMRGGRYINHYQNQASWPNGVCDTIFIGACPAAEGGVDAASYGRLRGWGSFSGSDEWYEQGYGARIRLGNGEILADGEGDESHVLDSNAGLNGVSSATPGQLTASGWRAVNKGAAIFPCNGMLTGGQENPIACVGCAPDAAAPDLVNAVRVTASGFDSEWATSQNKWLGVTLLAADRTDTHVEELPVGSNVLSVHKIGLFFTRVARTSGASCTSAQVTVRYDQTKIQKADTKLELWRYVAADQRWNKVGRLAPGVRPADGTIASTTALASLDETYNLGTFAVVERETKGLVVILY